MSRWKAAGIHLGISLIVAGIVASVIYFVWYPPPYFTIAGGSALMLLIMSVDVVIGPLLTLTVYRAGKKGLRFDLFVIAGLQVSAFCYGLSVIAVARPAFVVAVVDRFVAVAANQIEVADLAEASRPEFSTLSWFGPRMVGAVAPKDKTFELAQSAAAGRDIEKIPAYYVPYAQVADQIMAHGKPIATLMAKGPTESALASRFLATHGLQPDEVVYVPLQGRVTSLAMLLAVHTKQPIGTLPIDPW